MEPRSQTKENKKIKKNSYYSESESESHSESHSESDSQSESESEEERRDDREDTSKGIREDRDEEDRDEDDPEELDLFKDVARGSFLKLIRQAGAKSVSSDAAEELRDIMQDFILNMFTILAEETDTFTTDLIRKYMEGYIREESELVKQVTVSRGSFEKAIIELCQTEKVKMKRETVYVIQIYVETIMMKIVEGGILVAENSRRQRVLDKDLGTSYRIYIL